MSEDWKRKEIPPKQQWQFLTLQQLEETKTAIFEICDRMRTVGPSVYRAYAALHQEIERYIQIKTAYETASKQAESSLFGEVTEPEVPQWVRNSA